MDYNSPNLDLSYPENFAFQIQDELHTLSRVMFSKGSFSYQAVTTVSPITLNINGLELGLNLIGVQTAGAITIIIPALDSPLKIVVINDERTVPNQGLITIGVHTIAGGGSGIFYYDHAGTLQKL